MTYGWHGHMSTPLDDICKTILRKLLSGAKRYSQLQRLIGAGSLRTVKTHVAHLVRKRLARIVWKKEALRKYQEIQITASGRRYSK